MNKIIYPIYMSHYLYVFKILINYREKAFLGFTIRTAMVIRILKIRITMLTLGHMFCKSWLYVYLKIRIAV